MSLRAEPAPGRAIPLVPVRQMIEDRAMFSPEGMAVCDFDGRTLTWHELNARANRLADRLCELGAGPHRPVALVGRTEAAAIVGWLAALKADAPVVPLGGLSEAGVIDAINRTGARLMLTIGEAPSFEGVAVVPLHLDGPAPITPNLASRSLADHPVLLAPGPHGIVRVLPHDLMDFLRWQTRACQINDGDGVCLLAPVPTFIGLRLVAATLGLGAFVQIPPPPAMFSGSALWEFLQATRITRLFIEADALAGLAASDVARESTLDHLRDVVALGGTLRLTPDVLRFFALHPRCRVHSLHSAPDSAAIGACSLELPFAATTARAAAATGPASLLEQSGPFSALLHPPAVA